jgi:hypothetical protein
METVTGGGETADQSIEVIQRYFDVISRSNDPAELRAVDNSYKEVFNVDPPGTKTWEDFTLSVVHDVERGGDAILPRIGAISHVVRSMIQGNQSFPVADFEDVISRARDAMIAVDDSISADYAVGVLKAEIKDAWEPYRLQDPELYERAAEAYSLVSTPREYNLVRLHMAILRKLAR